jgi:hypothetical protein
MFSSFSKRLGASLPHVFPLNVLLPRTAGSVSLTHVEISVDLRHFAPLYIFTDMVQKTKNKKIVTTQ